MIASLTGALLRAVAVAVLVALPTVLLPAGPGRADQIVVLVALLVALMVFMEYNSTYPSIVEFRHAPPYNRLRFGLFAFAVLALTLVLRQPFAASLGGAVLGEIAGVLGRAGDFHGSPVRLVLALAPEGAGPVQTAGLRDMAALAYALSLLMVLWFIALIRLRNWPAQNGAFNVWVNLPMLSLTANGDIVPRMQIHAGLNLLLGIGLPFFLPGLLSTVAVLTGPVTLDGPQTTIWVLALWAFVPAGLVMRGIAINRIAVLILRKRHRSSTAARTVPAE